MATRQLLFAAGRPRPRPRPRPVSGLAGLTAFIVILIVAAVVIFLAAILAGATTLWDLLPMIIVGGVVGYSALIVGMWLISAFLAEALAGLALGRVALRADSLPVRIGAMLVGVVVVTLLLSIPIAGWWIGFVVFLFGLGGFCLWLMGTTPEAEPSAPAPARSPAYPTKPLKA